MSDQSPIGMLPIGPTLARLPRADVMLAAALLAAAAGLLVAPLFASIALVLAALALGLVAGAGAVARWRGRFADGIRNEAARLLAQGLSGPAYLADENGLILFANSAAQAGAADLPLLLADQITNPTALLYRLQQKALGEGAAQEEVTTRRGHMVVAAQPAGEGRFLWRIDEVAELQETRPSDALNLPMLTAGATGTVLYMNPAFRQLVGGRVKGLGQIFGDQTVRSGQILDVQGEREVTRWLVAELGGAGARREIYLLPTDAAEAPPHWTEIEVLPVPLLKIRPDGTLAEANREARTLLQIGAVDGLRLSDLLEGLGRPMIDWLRDTCAGRGQGGPQFLRGAGVRQDLFVQLTLNRAQEDDGQVLIGVLNDVTEFKALEAQFVQSQKMQAIGQLAGGIAHDFNNLLTAISGHCDLLLLRHDQSDGDFADLVQIHHNANRAAALVGQLLAFSRKQNQQLQVVDLRDTLADLTHLLNRLVGERITLDLVHDPELAPVRADRRQIEQVIMNLVVNARDAMAEGGQITIGTENLDLAEPMERDRATVPAGRYVRVTVADEGHGIAPEKMAKIFEPFYTTKRVGEGTGLGLSTAYGIVKQTGGFIFVDSQIGAGARFSILLPALDRETAVSPEALSLPDKGLPKPMIAGPRGGVVLLVEDEAPVRSFASRALALRGYSVVEADCGEAALEALRDPELHVDVIVSDVIMPGLDGPSWVRIALKHHPAMQVVFVSGYAEDAFGENQSLIPQSVFLQKPFSLTELTETVDRQMRQQTGQ